ncbi:hypothetical protein OSB04_031087 [Centaurea solstitialis]|uniref:Protein kinase domain-containing protein n=1 Tax=Centaurea solstitialis TaxID=347529 RepID=A0AA38W5M7_9ASTR|nr:hypothetical protein OSB04_031087 [Centaurea solstitialis]
MAKFFNEFQHLKIKLEEIKSATNNFGDNNLMGKRWIWEGVQRNNLSLYRARMAVFKRLDSALRQGNSEFWKEIMMLSGYTHENLVSLLGYCDEGGEKILVYEFASREALIGAKLSLDPRGTQQRVLHHDIKSSNILLDENWNAKVSDLGLSRIGPANTQFLSLICNARVQILVRMWKKSYKVKKPDKIIFQDMLLQMDLNSLETFSNIAYLCVHKYLEGRPKMAHVVKELETALEHQMTYEQRLDYEEMNRNHTFFSGRLEVEIPPLIYIPKEEPQMLLSKGNLLLAGKVEKDRPVPKFGEWDDDDRS